MFSWSLAANPGISCRQFSCVVNSTYMVIRLDVNTRRARSDFIRTGLLLARCHITMLFDKDLQNNSTEPSDCCQMHVSMLNKADTNSTFAVEDDTVSDPRHYA